MEEKNSEKKERKMRDSGIPWIGEVPDGWEFSKIKYHCTMKSGDNITALDISNNGEYPVYGGNGLRGFYKIYNKNGNHILIGRQGALAGNVHLVNGKFWATDHAVVVTLKNDVFINYFFRMLESMNLNQYAFDTAAQPGLSVSRIMNLNIVLPNLEEQHRIADFLDSKCSEIDTLIENLRARVESAKEYKKAVITEAVTKGLDKDAKMKDSGVEWIGEIPEGWDIARLKQVLKTPMKYGASESGVEYSDELPRYIRITDITLDNKLKDTGKLSLTEQQAIGYLLSEKTVLFARSGATVGKTFLYKPEYGRAAFAGYMISAIPNNSKIKAEWLYYYTLSQAYWDWVNSSFSQATIQNIGADKYSNLPIVIPSLITQQQVINYLDSKCSEIDALLQNYEDQIATLEEYKKSLIYEYVTGKKEVPKNGE